MIKIIRRLALFFTSILAIGFIIPSFASQSVDNEGVVEAQQNIEKDVQKKTDVQMTERRKKIIDEAVAALSKTKDALAALDDENTEDALNLLAEATGKLELIVARDPSLALAPIEVSIKTHDLYGSIEAIDEAVEEAKAKMKDGNYQAARHALNDLASEVVITVTSLPLATYPQDIKAITPLIDAGKLEEAKAGLQAALNTVVLTDRIMPLPILRSEGLLKKAEELSSKPERTDEENAEILGLLAEARNQLKMAQTLGYGKKSDFKPLYAQLSEIEGKTEDGISAEGFFDRINTSIAKIWN